MRATRAARLKVFEMFKITRNELQNYEEEYLRSAVEVGTVLRRLVMRGNRIVILKFHFNSAGMSHPYFTTLLPFPAHAFAGIFQNDTVRGQFIANAIGFGEITSLFRGYTLRY
jgi:hypothetical protein